MPTVAKGPTAALDCIETAPSRHLDQLDLHPAARALPVGSLAGELVRTQSLPKPQRDVTTRGGNHTVVARADHDRVTSNDGLDAVTSGDRKDISWP